MALSRVEVIRMKKEELRFRIDQLRKDKMIYTLESIALTFVIELFYLLSTVILGTTSLVLAYLSMFVATGYFMYAMLGNTRRIMKIKELEKELERAKA